MNPAKTEIRTSSLLDAYRNVRKHSEAICEPLKIEDYVPQPIVDVSPPKWHIAHTTWFFEELLLKQFLPGYKIYDPDFAYMFNSYYNTLGERVLRPNRGNMTRPSVEEIYAYRAYVDQYMEQLLNQEKLSYQAKELLILGMNHEQQHQELCVSDIKYILGHNPLFPVYKEEHARVEGQNSDKGWVNMKEGIYEIGFEGDGFFYDNEQGRHKVFLHDYEISKALVTNGEYMEFIEDGGYRRFDFWLDEGLAWVKNKDITAPLYWHKVNGRWKHFTLGGFKEIRSEDILCHISLYEAAAYAEWKGMRLATEFEWEAASDQFEWGSRWEWTNSAYLPYPNFAKAEGAVGEYNGKFMINQMVLRGASVATSPQHSRKTYRNFFHPHLRWQFTGIRLAK